MKRKPIVGETLYSLNVGNAARYTEKKLTPVTVISVGGKYFTCQPVGSTGKWSETKYHLDSWGEAADFMVESWLYETEQEWLDEKEAMMIRSEIRAKLHTILNGNGRCQLSLDQLRRIQAIVNETNNS
jgi:hypothetical protein